MSDSINALSAVSIVLGIACALWVVIHEMRHKPTMPIMGIVWPLTCLYSGPLGLWLYHRYGHSSSGNTPFAIIVAKATTHCGSGCTLGDIVAESLIFIYPAILTWLGWQSLFNEKIFSAWIFDYILAFSFGIFFQYQTIAPMKHLSRLRGLIQALKTDVLSLTAWQLGMYGFMALARYYIFYSNSPSILEANSPVFWFTMQIAMICGFMTSYPVNWIMVKYGMKEKM